MTTPDVTPFVETEVLIAVMEDDTARAVVLLNSMMPGELFEFSHQVSKLQDLIRTTRAAQRGGLPT